MDSAGGSTASVLSSHMPPAWGQLHYLEKKTVVLQYAGHSMALGADWVDRW